MYLYRHMGTSRPTFQTALPVRSLSVLESAVLRCDAPGEEKWLLETAASRPAPVCD